MEIACTASSRHQTELLKFHGFDVIRLSEVSREVIRCVVGHIWQDRCVDSANKRPFPDL